MKWILPTRVHEAVLALSEWRQRAQSQSAMHLLQLVPLLQRAKPAGTPFRYEEDDDKDFWDLRFRLAGSEEEPYFDPLTRDRRIRTHYHSNVATARKNTFANRWGAAEYETRDDGETWWTLHPEWSDIFSRRALTKRGTTQRVPVVDLAVLLLRQETWDETANARTLEDHLRQTLRIRDDEYDNLFVFENEDSARLFTDEEPARDEYEDAIREALLPRVEDSTGSGLGESDEQLDHLLPDDDSVLLQIRELLALRSSGIILRGVPGTGKTWYAREIAKKLTDLNPDRIHRVQFHPAFSYESFVEGYVPDSASPSGFGLVDKIFLAACDQARDSVERVVFIVDEINRGDPARVFGEVLTYIERDYRDQEFELPYSGKRTTIPQNLLIIGTMNPHDRSIAQLDQAFLRRFDHIDLFPSSEVVAAFLDSGEGFDAGQIGDVVDWFDSLQRILPDGIGHAYLRHVRKAEDLQAVWKYRMLPYCQMVLEFEPTRLKSAEGSFAGMYARVLGREGGD